jgi:lipoprotein-anchoring transpeptidase ErfK/SrfK
MIKPTPTPNRLQHPIRRLLGCVAVVALIIAGICVNASAIAQVRAPDGGAHLTFGEHTATGQRGEATAFHHADITATIAALTEQITSAYKSMQAALSASRCRHDEPPGKVMAVDLTTQEIVFYRDGCELGTSLITTGRAGLRTPTGTYHIFAKYSPIRFYSPWPKSSPYYYAPENAQYAMEFAAGGFFLHSAPWEPPSAFGPNSENGSFASHGCIHIPTPTMQWLYSWATIGTTLIISS